MTKKQIIIFTLLLLLTPFNSYAYSDYIIASGENIGIKLNTKSILVVGRYNNLNNYLNKGDIIVSINDDNDISVDLLSELIEKKNKIKIGYINKNKIKYMNLKVKDGKTGLYLKDSISGIGTLTFIDPNTKIYGALGHEIVDNNSGIIIEEKDGNILESTVSNIKKSVRGIPGEKNAKISNDVVGDIDSNTNKGIFGDYYKRINESNTYKVAQNKDIKLGKAYILTELNNNKVEKYSINILSINKKSDTKNILFEVTDDRLLSLGGIVQGMSGSPIIQGNNIVGAVTHVVIDNPKKGYGVFIVKMLEEAEKKDE